MSDPVADVVASCRQGDRDAQRELFETFQATVYRLTVRMVGLTDAADVTQQVFLQLFRTIDQFRGESRFSTWLYRLTVNECLQHIRRRKPAAQFPVGLDIHERLPSHTVQIEQRDLLEQALEKLATDLRAIFLLREVEQLDYAQMADVLEIAEGTVASRLNRARRELRKHLVELGWEP